MARRKVILPNWSANEADSKSIEMLGAEFSGLTQGELVINTNVDNTLLSTLNGDGKVVVFESSEMIDKRLEGFLDKVHQHDNKDVLDSITSSRTDAWDKAESNAKTYTDQQIDFIVTGASEAFETLKEVETWINNHRGETKGIIEDINSLYASAHTHSNKIVLDGITADKVTSWDAAEPNVITEISAVTKDNSNVISVNGKKVTIDLTNVGDENVIETIKVNNSALTVSDKTVNVDLSYLETAIEEIELTPGPKGDDGITPVFTAITANVNNTTGTPYVSVTSAKTDGEKYALAFEFQNLKGEKGDRGDDGTSIKILGTVNSPAEFPGNPSNGDGYMLNGHLWVYDGVSWIDAGEIKGPQGDPGTNAYISAVTASVSDTTGVPSVKVITGGTHSEMSIDFEFNNLKGPQGDKGTSIVSIGRTGGDGAAGTTDEYTITYSDGTTSTFNVYNGEDGKDGITPVFTAVTASVNNATGTPRVSVVTAKTADEKYSMEFSFQNMKGEKGDKGDDGTSVKILGTKNSYNELPSSNNVNGDGYIIGENLYVWNGSTWQDVGKVKGPQGDPGTNAYITGVTASVGNTTGTPTVGVTTAGTPSNISFNLSFNGLKGEPGDDGENGIGIKSFVITNGNGAAGTIDTYTITFTNGVTSAITVYNGSNGTNGEDGEDGANGNMWHVGTGVPLTTLGVAGDLYLEGIVGTVYQKRDGADGEEGYWLPTDCNLKGADGTNGEDGEDGVTPIFSAATATISNTTGTPKVTVTSAATGSVYSLDFAFSGLKGADGANGEDGKNGEDGVTPVFSSATATITNTTGTPEVTVTSAATGSVYSLNFEFSGLKGADGSDGQDGTNGERGYSYFSTTSLDNLTSASTWINRAYVNNSGDVRTNDYIVSREGEVFRVTGSTTSYFNLSYVASFRGPQGATGTFDSSELNNYVQTGNTDYLNANSFSFIGYSDYETNDDLNILSANIVSDTIYLVGENGITLSGNTNPEKIYIRAPKLVFSLLENTSETNYPLLGTHGYQITLGNFFSLDPRLYSDIYSGYTWAFLDVKTGTTSDSIAVGNHNHNGTYSPIITQTTGSSIYYLLGVDSKTASTVTKAYVSSTDIYMQGGEIYAASDETLKNFGESIEIDFDKLAEIPKVYYTWKTDADNKQQIGTSAQKLREIYPELVSESEDGKLAVSYEKLSIIVLAAVDKLHKENEELKDRLKRIEEKLGL